MTVRYNKSCISVSVVPDAAVLVPFLCRKKNNNRWWKTSAVTAACKMNPSMLLVYKSMPVCKATDGAYRSIYSSKCKAKLYWKLHRCGDSAKQPCPHYRYCRPHALQKPSDLWCAVCSYDNAAWQSEGLALLPVGEESFIRNFLQVVGVDVQYCRQVVPDWWSWPVDFWNFEHNIYVQVDGHVHWHGMHGCTSEIIQNRDMAFNKKAYEHDACLVRVHSDDISNTQQLLAALGAAIAGGRIVLTQAYAQQSTSQNGKSVMYVEALLEKLGSHRFETDDQGNLLIP